MNANVEPELLTPPTDRLSATRRGGPTNGGPAYFVSADWSKLAIKRSVHIADLGRRQVSHEKRPDWDLPALVERALELSEGGSVLIGIDLALGLPESYWTLLPSSAQPARDFVEWLSISPGSDVPFCEVATTATEWAVERPFFRVPPGEGSLTSFHDRVEGRLLRRIEFATAAKPLFAVSGIPGTVGSGTRALWKELAPMLPRERCFKVWPFEGSLDELLTDSKVTIAETYPGLAYAAALAPSLPTRRLLVSKTKRRAREQACDLLASAEWVQRFDVDLGDLWPARIDEDVFDSHLTAAAVLRCVLEDRPLCDSGWIDPVAEGAMLLSGPVDPSFPARRLTSGAPSDATAKPNRARNEAPAIRKHREKLFPCPIRGCAHVFRNSRGGWDSHVASRAKHPSWHPSHSDPDERKRLFRQEFQGWFL